MADRAALEAAAKAGVITPEQVGPLAEFLDAGTSKPAIVGEEDLRFIRNFHDVFLAIGIVLFAIGLGVGIGTQVSSAPSAAGGAVLAGGLTAGAAIVMWLLGEFFARRRRLFLPAIAIVSAFTAFAVVSAASLYFGLVLGQGVDVRIDQAQGVPPVARNGLLLAAAMGILAPAAFYARFRLPFSLGMAGAGAAIFIIVACLLFSFRSTLQNLPALYLSLGVLLFLAGVAFDARDPTRVTRFSDNGFWLHFAAAPLILNGVFGLIGHAVSGEKSNLITSPFGIGSGVGMVPWASATLIAVALLGLVSLLINRRALIVSALLTAGIAIGVLLNAAGLGAGALAAATLITLGAFVLILGAAWHVARRALLGWVKPDGPFARVFPPEPGVA